jgi:hypothetical protein
VGAGESSACGWRLFLLGSATAGEEQVEGYREVLAREHAPLPNSSTRQDPSEFLCDHDGVYENRVNAAALPLAAAIAIR